MKPFHDKLSMSKFLCFIHLPQSHTVYDKFISLYSRKLLLKIMASAYSFVLNIVILINITINKTHNIHDSVKKTIYAATTYNFAVNIVMMINT